MTSGRPDFTQLANVNIVGQTVTLEIKIVASDVTLNVNVTNAELNVNITNSSAVLDVNIASSAATLNINIAGSTATLDVNIAGQAADLNVNISASSVTLDINLAGQDVGLWDILTWAAKEGSAKRWMVQTTVTAGSIATVITYTVPAGQKLYITALTVSWMNGGHRYEVGIRDATAPAYVYYFADDGPLVQTWPLPLTIPAGHTMEVKVYNRGSSDDDVYLTLLGYVI